MNFEKDDASWWPEELPSTWFNQNDPQLKEAMLKLGRLHDAHRKVRHPDYWHRYFSSLFLVAFVVLGSMLALEIDFALVSGVAVTFIAWIGLRYYWTRIVYHRYHSHFINVRLGKFGYAVMFEGDTEWHALNTELGARKLDMLDVACSEGVEPIITGYLLETLDARRTMRGKDSKDKMGATIAIEGAANIAAIEICRLERSRQRNELD